MEREGRSPLRILRQALRISDVLGPRSSFLPKEILPVVLGKPPNGQWCFRGPHGFRKQLSPSG